MERSLQRLRENDHLPQAEWVNLLVQETVRLTESVLGYFAVTNDDVTQLTMLAWSKTAMAVCAMSEIPIEYPVEATGLWGDCIRERRAVVTNDYEACTRVTKKGYPDGHVPVQRHMNVAVMSGETIKGILGVGNKAEAYTEQDAARLQAFANAIWPIFASVRERAAV